MINLRRAVQWVCSLLFISLLLWAQALPSDLPFRLDPLTTGLVTLGTLVLTASLILVGALLVVTLLWGRLFCGWACPLGALIDAVDFVLARGPRLRGCYGFKDHLALLLLGAAAGGLFLTWALDPLNWAARTHGVLRADFPEPLLSTGIMVALLLLAATLGRRGFCRILCPLGALLGFFGRFSLTRWSHSPACTTCGKCVTGCRMAAIGDEQSTFRHQECIRCYQCAQGCPATAITFPLSRTGVPPAPDQGRRAYLLSLTGAATTAVGLRLAPNLGLAAPGARPLRPPGSVHEALFVDLCVRCGACMRVCPTRTLAPSRLGGGLLALESPVLLARRGGCLFQCNACGQRCPTGAIKPLSLEKKRAAIIGVAKVDRGRCLPHARGRPCLACHAACPLEAIKLQRSATKTRWGAPLFKIKVDPRSCTGCGLCEASCPLPGDAAIHIVVAAGRDGE